MIEENKDGTEKINFFDVCSSTEESLSKILSIYEAKSMDDYNSLGAAQIGARMIKKNPVLLDAFIKNMETIVSKGDFIYYVKATEPFKTPMHDAKEFTIIKHELGAEALSKFIPELDADFDKMIKYCLQEKALGKKYPIQVKEMEMLSGVIGQFHQTERLTRSQELKDRIAIGSKINELKKYATTASIERFIARHEKPKGYGNDYGHAFMNEFLKKEAKDYQVRKMLNSVK